MVMNVNAIASKVLTPLDELCSFELVRTTLTYSAGMLEPEKATETIKFSGNIQPFNSKRHTSFTKIQEIARAFTSTNTTITENIYVIYANEQMTMRDQRVMVADDILYGRGKKYVVIENVPWRSAGWCEVLVREENDDRSNQ